MISNVIDLDQVDEGMLVAFDVCEELDNMKMTYQASSLRLLSLDVKYCH